MKIVLIAPGGFDRSGSERVIPALLWLTERLARRNEVHVCVLGGADAPARYTLAGAQVHVLGRVVGGLPGTQTVLYVDVNGILAALQGILPNDAYQQFLDQGGKNLQPITSVVAGGAASDRVSTYRVVVRIP